MTDHTDKTDKNARRLARSAVLSGLPILVSSVGLFAITFSRTSSEEGELAAVNDAVTAIALLVGFFLLLFAFSVVTQGGNRRFAAKLQNEREGAVAIGANLTGSTKRLMRKALAEGGARVKGNPPTLMALVADRYGIELCSGGVDQRRWLRADWTQLETIEAGKIVEGARVYNGLIIRFQSHSGLQPVELILLRPGMGAWSSTSAHDVHAAAEEMRQLSNRE
jgi:hypothetical protein